MNESALIFLSYASPDYDRVYEYFTALVGQGLDPWLDKEKLVAGQNWDFEIKRALARAAIIVVFLSKSSVLRRGYVQREIRIALDQALNKLHDDIYVIPVMLDDVPIPPQLEDIQVVRATADDSYKQLSVAIETQLKRLGQENTKLQGDTNLRWSTVWSRDKWEGLPGYECSYQLLRFASEQNPQAGEITHVIRGWAAAETMRQRAVKFHQDSALFSFGQEPFFRTNSWEASCGAPSIQGQVVSISYTVWMMGAGAAHPNMYFKTFAFTLNPVCQISSLRSLFSDLDKALEVIQKSVRYQLLHDNERFPADDPDSVKLDEEWVNSGTATWDSFDAFTFTEGGIQLSFPPYQVAAYALGPQFASVKYSEISEFMHRYYAHALGVRYL